MSSPHFLYRCFDEAGELLYVGCTADIATRLRQHSEWADHRGNVSKALGERMTYLTAERHPDLAAAREAEAQAIATEQPALNVQHSGRPSPRRIATSRAVDPASERFSDRVALAVQQAMTAAGVTQRDLSQATGIPRTTLIRRLRGQPFTLAEMEAIAAALGVGVADLLAEPAPH